MLISLVTLCICVFFLCLDFVIFHARSLSSHFRTSLVGHCAES